MAENIRRLTEADLAPLERMCDDYSLYEVLWALARICFEKADGLEQVQGFSDKWQPEADRWRKRGLQVQATAEYLERLEMYDSTGVPRTPFTGRLKR